jgi:hypothetical protein
MCPSTALCSVLCSVLLGASTVELCFMNFALLIFCFHILKKKTNGNIEEQFKILQTGFEAIQQTEGLHCVCTNTLYQAKRVTWAHLLQ